MSLKIEWDEAKARSNQLKHGVSFEEAETVFADPLGWIYADPLHSEYERREILIGESSRHRLLLVCFTELSEGNVRIFSSRVPTTHERRKYEAERGSRGH